MLSAKKAHELIAKIQSNVDQISLTDIDIKILVANNNNKNHCILTKKDMLGMAYKILINKGYKVEWLNNTEDDCKNLLLIKW